MIARRSQALVLALLAAAAPALGQTAQPTPPSGDYYDLGDYDYFGPTPPPTPAPRSTPTTPASSQPSPARASSTSVLPAQSQRITSAQAAPIAPGDLAAARAAAKELATEGRRAAAAIPATPSIATTVPGYSPATPPQAALFDDPDALVSQGTSASVSSVPYQTVIDPDRTTVTVSRDAIARAIAVEDDPRSYLDGEELASGNGSCRPLPPSTAGQDYYEATCNEGLKVEQADKSCRIPLVVTVEPGPDRYQYVCEDVFDRFRRNNQRLCMPFQASIDAGVCREIDRERVGQQCLQGTPQNCTEPGDPIYAITLQCDTPVTARPYTLVTTSRVVSERRDETQCQAATAGLTCATTAETCVDAAPETRIIDGVAVTRSCWAWERTLSCHRTSAATDCADLEARPSCTFDREICLDDPPDGACKVEEKVFRCPVPGGQVAGGPEFICGDDVYCINGDCEPIVREASTEFQDALVGLHTLGQANAEFDEATLTLFSGTRESCHKPVFGLVNCCAGKTSGALSAASGLAALAGGPGAIAALATPFLTYFMCSTKEMMLDIKDRMGFCHKVGTWCSDSFLGICTSKRTAYCCFESKLSRILQQQGRPQLGKAWGEPKKEQCKGFSVEEFARLDLSRMDFREVYAEFIDAAKLPDELATARAIQERIEAYYRAHGPK